MLKEINNKIDESVVVNYKNEKGITKRQKCEEIRFTKSKSGEKGLGMLWYNHPRKHYKNTSDEKCFREDIPLENVILIEINSTVYCG